MTEDSLAANIRRTGSILQQLARCFRKRNTETSLDNLSWCIAGLDHLKTTRDLLPKSGKHFQRLQPVLEISEQILSREIPLLVDLSKRQSTDEVCKMAVEIVARLDTATGPVLDQATAEFLSFDPNQKASTNDEADHEFQLAIDLRNQDPTLSWRKIREKGLGLETNGAQARAFAEAVRRYAKKTHQRIAEGRKGAPRKRN